MVSSAACGADLIALQEARTLEARRRVVLPFGRQQFRASSVTDRPGDWGERFDRIVDEVTAAGDLTTLAGSPGDDAAYAAVNTAILDEAEAVGRRTGQEICAVIVWDGKSRGEGDLTEAFAAAARARGWRVHEVLTLRTCFVVQGFGEKPDLLSGRVLNLDASYEVLKEAVEEAGLRCVRADEIIHSGTIDKPMYEWLYRADLVIADLSTYNVNAAYELGVRYGVRPGTTMIVAENQFKNPFDVSHIVTLPVRASWQGHRPQGSDPLQGRAGRANQDADGATASRQSRLRVPSAPASRRARRASGHERRRGSCAGGHAAGQRQRIALDGACGTGSGPVPRGKGAADRPASHPAARRLRHSAAGAGDLQEQVSGSALRHSRRRTATSRRSIRQIPTIRKRSGCGAPCTSACGT